MTILWTALELLVNLFQGMAFVYYPYSHLGAKDGRSFIKSKGIVYGVILFAMITACNYCVILENFVVYFLVIFIYSLTQLNKGMLKKVFFSILPVLIIILSSAFVTNLMSVILNVDLSYILSEKNFERFITIIVVQLIIVFVMMLSQLLFKSFDKGKNELGIHEWILIVTVLLISAISTFFLHTISLESISMYGRRYIVCVVLGIVLINVAVCFLVTELGKKNTAMRENAVLKIEQVYNKQLADNARDEYGNVRKLRHDFKDGYSVISDLLSDKRYEQAFDYVNTILKQVSSEIFVNTNNVVINAIINSKFSKARNHNIDVTCISVADFDGIDDIDLSRLLSNLIENAIDACLLITDMPREIVVKISSDEYKYGVFVKNTINESVLSKNPSLHTTKPDPQNHGYGNKIVKEISDKYGGQVDYYEEFGYFCCNVLLKKGNMTTA